VAKTILIGCRLPHGLRIEHPENPSIFTVISGLNSVQVIGQKYALTEVDEALWGAFKTANPKFKALLNEAIFESKTKDDAADRAKDLKKVKTGFEQMPQKPEEVKKAD
jgi:hypothetical protein